METGNREVMFLRPEYWRWHKTVLLSQPAPRRNWASVGITAGVSNRAFPKHSCTAVSSSCLPFCWDYPNSKRNPRTCFLCSRRNIGSTRLKKKRVCATASWYISYRSFWKMHSGSVSGGISISLLELRPLIVLQSSFKALDGKNMDTKVNGNISFSFSNN